jgi:hypothetical protein
MAVFSPGEEPYIKGPKDRQVVAVHRKPNPSVVVRQILEDGSEVEVIWSWLGETRQAKLVTVYLAE